jgi:hypothetical protein
LGVGREANNLTSQNNNCYETLRRPRPTQGSSAKKEELSTTIIPTQFHHFRLSDRQAEVILLIKKLDSGIRQLIHMPEIVYSLCACEQLLF